ncbi:hypothetical protein BH11BAC4_BH11BAC4_13520 [soil metagenome]
MRYFTIIVLLIFIFSCKAKNDVPEGIIPPQKMQEVFWDFVRADVYVNDHLQRDSTRNLTLENLTVENLKMQQSIFKQHNISKASFYKSYTYYSNHKELMTKMIDTLIARKRIEKKPAGNSDRKLE